ncbi:MAG: BrnT family toxin [Pseudomonadota bacterium]|nr:BrnT family toxin [Pseudomonadota bacterium]
MRIEFDLAKSEANRAKHGVELAAAAGLEWDTAMIWLDTRKNYGEDRECGIGYIGLTLYFVAFVDRDETRRIISLRKANRKEVKRYAEA